MKPDASLFDPAIESGYNQPEVRLQRAHVRSRNNDPGSASEDAMRVLETAGVPFPVIWETVSLVEPDKSDEVAASPVVMSLDLAERFGLRIGSMSGRTPSQFRCPS